MSPPLLLNLPAIRSRLVGHHTLDCVVVTGVSVADRIGTTDMRATSVVAGFTLIAGAAANRGFAFYGGSAFAVVAGLALRTGTSAMDRLLANVSGIVVTAVGLGWAT